jgi:hypothetical protein
VRGSLHRARSLPGGRRGALALAAGAAGATALIAFELARGGAGYGEARLHDPCLPRTGASTVLRGVDAIACKRGESREQFLLDAADSPLGNVAASVPNLRDIVERWLEQALEGRKAHGGKGAAGELAEQAFRVLDELFGR